MQRQKIMRHDVCGGTVSHKTLVCDRCEEKPAGNGVTLVRLGGRRG